MSTVSKTCQSCADSKVRCVRNTDPTGACDRCRRLGRECVYRQIGRRFKGFQKDRKIAALESKINELMVNRAGSADDNDNSPDTHSNILVDGDAVLGDVISRGLLDIGTAERYLNNFKTRLTPHFPFVVVPPRTSAEQLRQQGPFLLLAIFASASYENMQLQRMLGEEVKKVVASRMIINGEVSFELLQGLLVFLAWTHYHSRPHRYTQFLQLAISLVIDLRLDRPPETRMWKTPLRFRPQTDLQDQTLRRPSWGSDEQRAVLGCYYLSSSVAMLVQKKSTILRFPYQEDCCKALREADEYPHDKYIDYVIRLQYMVEKIDNVSAKHELDLEKPGSGSELYITNLKSDLEEFYRHLPFDLYENPLLAIQYHATGLCLYQLALNISRQRPSSHLEFYSWINEMSVSAFISANSILNLYLQLPPNEEVGFNNTQWMQMGLALLVAYRYTAATPKSDHGANFLHALSELQSRLATLSTSDVDMHCARDVFFDFRSRVTRIKDALRNSDKQENDSQISESFQSFQPSLEPTDLDKFMEAEEHIGSPLWNLLTSTAESAQLSYDDTSAYSFEQIMGGWL
ncbi:hypothetical protein BJY01DRAFT_54992 [Aspergillus pseudoustus]|uniref:Zn(2)-C6 fungal-type domain-containing protein n=1 Tax=Aspergillus pseudoustus TaxID=1810923 RepID=A0ABR4J939_9EURO